jgi:F-type H+-transporting ATPase subunit b
VVQSYIADGEVEIPVEILMYFLLLSGDKSQPWWDYQGLELWKFLNLLAFVAAMTYVLRRRLTDALRSRREGIRRAVLKAQDERDEALRQLAEVDSRLATVESEVAGIWSKARAEARAERERILQDTEAEMLKLRAQSQREIESAGKVARTELRLFAARQSVKTAEEVIRREIQPEDDANLIRLSIEGVVRSGI